MCKIKRISAVLIAVVMVALLLCTAGCKKSSVQGDASGKDDTGAESTEKPEDVTVKAGGVINLSVGPYDSFNPLKTSNEDVRVYTGLIYEDLVNINAVMEPVPNIIESWVNSEDFKIWEFTLRDDVLFHDGTEVNAESVKALIDYILSNGGNYSENVDNVSGCFVKDDFTVQFVLEEPDSMMPSKMSIPLLSKETLKGDNGENKPVGTGMYKFSSKKDNVITLEKNDEFFDEARAPYIDTVKMTIYKSEYEKYGSDFDLAFFYGNRLSSYIFDESTKTYDFCGKTCNYVAVNCKPSYTLETPDEDDKNNIIYTDIHNAFEDSKVRKAVSILIDRNEVCDIAAAGKGTAVLYPAYSGTSYWQGKYSVGASDQQAAYKLLQEAGYSRSENDGLWYYKDGTALVVEAISPDDDFELRSVMRGVKINLERLGITVNLQELSTEEFSYKVQKKQYMLMPVQLELGSWIDVEKIYATEGEYNYSFYSNSVIDGYFTQLKSLGEKAVLSAGYNSIEDILIEDCPVIGLYIGYDTVVIRDNVSGVKRESFYGWDPLAAFYSWGITEE